MQAEANEIVSGVACSVLLHKENSNVKLCRIIHRGVCIPNSDEDYEKQLCHVLVDIIHDERFTSGILFYSFDIKHLEHVLTTKP